MEFSLLKDLAIILFSCGIFAIICHYLKLPLLLGYIVAGYIVGPNFNLAPTINDATTIHHLSELGVIFLMFFIGLEFDLFKLKKIFLPSIAALILQTTGMIFIGIMIAPLFHWSGLSGLFLGALLSMGSTMVTIPILNEQGALKTEYAQCAIGRLIMEDMLAILLLVILSGIAVTGHFAWNTAWHVCFLLGIFVVMVFCIGKFFAPFFINAIFRSESAEILVVAVVGTMLAICVLAAHFELSVALGAFLVGAILANTNISESIEHLTAPLRTIFGAVFFASIGIMTDIGNVLLHWKLVLTLSVLTILGQTFLGSMGLFLTGKTAETSFRAAFCQSQIGEFSFIIASLGTSLGVVDKNFVSITSGIAIGTILMTSMLNRRADKIFQTLQKHCPKFITELGTFYHNLLKLADHHLSKSELLKIIAKPLLKAILWFFLLSGTLFSVSYIAAITKEGKFNNLFHSNIMQDIIWTFSFILCLPFLVGLIKNLNNILFGILGQLTAENIRNKQIQTRMFGILRYITSLIMLFFFSGIFLSIASHYLPSGIPIAYFGITILLIGVLLWRRLIKVNTNLEHVFIESFNDKIESNEQKQRNDLLKKLTEKQQWKLSTEEIALRANYAVIGTRIADTMLRPRSGATIIAVSRNGFTEYNPPANTLLFPGDHVILLGDETQLSKAKALLETESSSKIQKQSEFNLTQVCIGNHVDFVNKIISQLRFRSKYDLNIVSIQRGSERVLDINADTMLMPNDVLWLTGSKEAINNINNILGLNQQA